jgi:uncharacterized membrane protein YeiH
VLREEVYALAALLGAVIVVAGDWIGADPLPVLILGAALAAFVRILSVLRGWQAPKAPGPRD